MIHLFRSRLLSINRISSNLFRNNVNKSSNKKASIYKSQIRFRLYCNINDNSKESDIVVNESDNNSKEYSTLADIGKIEQYFGKEISLENISSLNSILIDLILEEKYEELEKTFFSNIKKNDSMKPDVLSFAIMLNYYCKHDHSAIAGNVYKLMKNLEIKPNALCLNSFMEMHRRKGSRADVLRWFNRFKEENVIPTLVTYKILLSSYSTIEPIDINGALNCFQEMIDNNVVPDSFVYALMVEMYFNKNNINEAINWIHKMNNANLDFIDNDTRLIILKVYDKLKSDKKNESVRSYNKLLQEYSERAELKKALDVWEEMKNKGENFDSTSYGYMIQLFSKTGNLDKAIEYYDVMTSKGLDPDRITLTAMLNVFRKKGYHERYVEIYNRMQKRI